MQSTLGIFDYIIIILMMAISTAIGLYFRFTGGRQKTVDEYLMGGKEMTIFTVSFSLMATFMSAIAVLGFPAEAYMYGTQFVMCLLGNFTGGLIANYGFLPVFFDLDYCTSYGYLEKRFGKTTRTIVAFLFLVQTIPYISIVLYAPSIALNAVTGLPTWYAVISIAGVATFYCTLGGIKAVVWTDVFQAILMFVTVTAVIIGGSCMVGFTEVFKIANDGGRLVLFNMSTSMTERYTFWNSFITGVYVGLQSFGTSQAEIQRILSVGKLKKAQISVIFGITLIVIFHVLCYWAGIVLYAIYENCDPVLSQVSHLNSPDQMMPFTMLKLFRNIPGLTGLCIAGIFSASLSTISAVMNSQTSVTVEDFVKPYCRCNCLNEKWMAFTAKCLVVTYGVICLLLTYIVSNFRGVMEASSIMSGGVAAPVLGVFLLGMFSKNANELGTLIGLVVGCAFNYWIGFGSLIAKVNIPSLQRSTSGCHEMSNVSLYVTETLNYTSLIDIGGNNATFAKYQEESHVFPLYKISYLWIPIFGCVAVLIVGSLFSLLTSFCIQIPAVQPQVLSPFVRQIYFRTDTKENLNEVHSPENVVSASRHQNSNLKY